MTKKTKSHTTSPKHSNPQSPTLHLTVISGPRSVEGDSSKLKRIDRRLVLRLRVDRSKRAEENRSIKGVSILKTVYENESITLEGCVINGHCLFAVAGSIPNNRPPATCCVLSSVDVRMRMSRVFTVCKKLSRV